MPQQTLKHFIADLREFFTSTKNTQPPENIPEPQLDEEDGSEMKLSKSAYFFQLTKVYDAKIEFWLAKMRKFSYAFLLLAIIHLCKIVFSDSIDAENSRWSDLMEVNRAQSFVLSNYPLVGSILDLIFVKGLIIIMSFTLCYQYYSKTNTENMRRLNVIYYATNVDIFFFMLHMVFFVWAEYGRSFESPLPMLSNPLFNTVLYIGWVLTILLYTCFCHAAKELSLNILIKTELIPQTEEDQHNKDVL
ncbi:hypothetical protein FDP41_010308 [Naegleria fowleri]|uniref:Uncharacterized protein n=1 Tax=Naegleria fowleri TaxID=5763 RepID=A0A6A5BYM9_NAEFO|nr:uncharacterized protein FDP41_010308 [Naegleria fowleri]KAF0983243.1 hypothetical protein FDP41_010308 [Naegleria fowleri]